MVLIWISTHANQSPFRQEGGFIMFYCSANKMGFMFPKQPVFKIPKSVASLWINQQSCWNLTCQYVFLWMLLLQHLILPSNQTWKKSSPTQMSVLDERIILLTTGVDRTNCLKQRDTFVLCICFDKKNTNFLFINKLLPLKSRRLLLFSVCHTSASWLKVPPLFFCFRTNIFNWRLTNYSSARNFRQWFTWWNLFHVDRIQTRNTKTDFESFHKSKTGTWFWSQPALCCFVLETTVSTEGPQTITYLQEIPKGIGTVLSVKWFPKWFANGVLCHTWSTVSLRPILFQKQQFKLEPHRALLLSCRFQMVQRKVSLLKSQTKINYPCPWPFPLLHNVR